MPKMGKKWPLTFGDQETKSFMTFKPIQVPSPGIFIKSCQVYKKSSGGFLRYVGRRCLLSKCYKKQGPGDEAGLLQKFENLGNNLLRFKKLDKFPIITKTIIGISLLVQVL